MEDRLLICIAFHLEPHRVQYLTKVLARFINTYKVPFQIIIDTNSHDTHKYLPKDPRISLVVHKRLKHPWNLTWAHRGHIKRKIDTYDVFMYLEDDMDIPYENYLSYLEKFKLLWPKAVPGFVRLEESKGEYYHTDSTYPHVIPRSKLVEVKGRRFTSLANPYYAFWIMPRTALKETLSPQFTTIVEGGTKRITAASYLIAPWGPLKKPALVELTLDLKVHPNSYCYHLPNNYIGSPFFARFKIKDLVKVTG